MKRNINKKGFTLVELLAVIVILAVLALVAMPNVTRLMNDSRKNAFITEVENFVTYAQTSYTNSQISGLTSDTGSEDESLIPGQSFNGTIYDYYCVSYKQLVNGGFIQKSNGKNYGGIFEIYMPTDGTASTTIIYMTNGNYYVNGMSINKLANKGNTESTTQTDFAFINNSAASLKHDKCYKTKDDLVASETLQVHSEAALGAAHS